MTLFQDLPAEWRDCPQLLYHPIGYCELRRVVAYEPPAFLGWFIVSLVSGSIMYWSLQRGAAAGAPVYELFE